MVQRRFSSIVSKRMLPVTSSWRVGGSPIHPGTTALHMALVSPFLACGFHMRLGAQYHSISLKLRIPRMVTRQLWSKHLARGVPSPGFDPVCHQWSEPSETKRHGNPEDFLSCVSSRFKPEVSCRYAPLLRGIGIIFSVCHERNHSNLWPWIFHHLSKILRSENVVQDWLLFHRAAILPGQSYMASCTDSWYQTGDLRNLFRDIFPFQTHLVDDRTPNGCG